jgi:hypothetical protein
MLCYVHPLFNNVVLQSRTPTVQTPPSVGNGNEPSCGSRPAFLTPCFIGSRRRQLPLCVAVAAESAVVNSLQEPNLLRRTHRTDWEHRAAYRALVNWDQPSGRRKASSRSPVIESWLLSWRQDPTRGSPPLRAAGVNAQSPCDVVLQLLKRPCVTPPK